MKNLKFQRLTIISDSTKTANQFVLGNHLTLITATDNSVGKSTLPKLLLWAMGCQPVLDSTWDNLDCKVHVTFQIGDQEYEVFRYKDIIKLKIGKEKYISYSKVSGDFAEKMAEILEFKALLPNRDDSQLDVPPPSFYFVPFYIDQKRSWSEAWDNFKGLGQYVSWKKTIISYHIGLLTPSHFEHQELIFQKKKEAAETARKIEKIESAIEVVESYTVPEANLLVTLDSQKFQRIEQELTVELAQLSIKQEELFDSIAKSESERAHLMNQKKIAYGIMSDLELDYDFALNAIPENEIECPICGTKHDNKLLQRASLLKDQNQIKKQSSLIDKNLHQLNNRIIKERESLEQIKNNIYTINQKYSFESEKGRVDTNNIVEAIGSASIKRRTLEEKQKNIQNSALIEKKIKEIKKAQKKLITKEFKEELNENFSTTLFTYVSKLDALGINLSEITSPMDYAKIVKEGGAAEGTRGVLAYYLTIFSMIEASGNEVIAPLIIDTPNQQEQSIKNYENIIELLTTKLSDKSQIILCAMDNEAIKPLKEEATVIELNKNKLLDKEKYDEIKLLFDEILKDDNSQSYKN